VTTAICQASGSLAQAERGRALYATMVRLRRFEEKAGMLYAMGTLSTPCPLGYGQEAAIAAIADGLEPTDVLVSHSLSPALELALGASPATLFQRLVSASDPAGTPLVRLFCPGEEGRLLPRQEALRALHEASPGNRYVLAFSPTDLVPLLEPGNSVLAVLVTPSDRRPETWPLPCHIQVRECDGASFDAVSAALGAARDTLASGQGPLVLAILTPPYVGHARDPARRSIRRDTPDPVALFRETAVASGYLSGPEATVLENAVRDEIATAGRAVSLSCAP